MAINSGIAKNKDIYPSPDLGGGTRPRDGTTGVQATTENEFAIWRKVERGEGGGIITAVVNALAKAESL